MKLEQLKSEAEALLISLDQQSTQLIENKLNDIETELKLLLDEEKPVTPDVQLLGSKLASIASTILSKTNDANKRIDNFYRLELRFLHRLIHTASDAFEAKKYADRALEILNLIQQKLKSDSEMTVEIMLLFIMSPTLKGWGLNSNGKDPLMIIFKDSYKAYTRFVATYQNIYNSIKDPNDTLCRYVARFEALNGTDSSDDEEEILDTSNSNQLAQAEVEAKADELINSFENSTKIVNELLTNTNQKNQQAQTDLQQVDNLNENFETLTIEASETSNKLNQETERESPRMLNR